MSRIFPKVSYPYIRSTPKNGLYFGGRWGAHSYLDSPKYNKITENFRNWIPLRVLNCLKCDDNLNIGFEQITGECVFALVVDSH